MSEGQVEVSVRGFQALALICSAQPVGTYYPYVGPQLNKLLRHDGSVIVQENFPFRHGFSLRIDDGINKLAFSGALIPCGDGTHRTDESLYSFSRLASKDFSESERNYLAEIGMRLETKQVVPGKYL